MPPKTTDQLIEDFRNVFVMNIGSDVHELVGFYSKETGLEYWNSYVVEDWLRTLITTLHKETEEAYEKGYGRGLEVGELQNEEAVAEARQDMAKVMNDLFVKWLEDNVGTLAKEALKQALTPPDTK